MGVRVAIDREEIRIAPYVWKRAGKGAVSSLEANKPGAYVRATFRNATRISLLVRGEANSGCPADAMPLIECPIDFGPFSEMQLSESNGEYMLPLYAGWDTGGEHRIDVYFRVGRLAKER